MFAVMDGNEDGVVDFVEYLLHMNTLIQGNIDERLGLAFDMYVNPYIQFTVIFYLTLSF